MIQIKAFVATGVIVLTSAFGLCGLLSAQGTDDEVRQAIGSRDTAFWTAYNACDVKAMGTFFTDDVEFYHDKGGPTLGLADLVASFHKFCESQKVIRIRREAVKDTVQIFPMKNGDSIYGAVISGQHYFYLHENGKSERLDGLARFTHLWLLKDGVWKMSRVLSFDHGPAPYVNKRITVTLSNRVLKQYTGEYSGLHSKGRVSAGNGSLMLTFSNDKNMQIFPESKNNFFSKERDLTFEFVKNGNGKTAKIIVRENGDIAEEMVRQN